MDQPHQYDLSALLPEDVLADILRRLAPRWLAASRCVCKAWRDTVDARRLLRADLLPLSFTGIFMYLDWHGFSEFFSRPSSTTGPAAAAPSVDLNFLPSVNINAIAGDYTVWDHCNGLLLLEHYVVNPATRRWNSLPERLPEINMGTQCYDDDEYLAFDPTLSTHYQVFRIPSIHQRPRDDVIEPLLEESEWPPTPYFLQVFSSRSGCWEKRSLAREGDATGTVAEMRVSWTWSKHRYSAYWREALYVHCQTNYLMRISLSDDKYRVIKPPVGIRGDPYLGKSKKGLYFASVDEGTLQVWILNESCDRVEWTLKHENILEPILRHGQDGPWILKDINYNFLIRYYHSIKDEKKVVDETDFEWSSDNDDVLDNVGKVIEECRRDIKVLGFHPYKEIVFLRSSLEIGLAYHLNSSKLEALGNIYPTGFKEYFLPVLNEWHDITPSFPYTSCWMEEFPRNN